MTSLEGYIAELASIEKQLADIGHVESYGTNGRNINYRKHKELTDRKDVLNVWIKRLNGVSPAFSNIVVSSK